MLIAGASSLADQRWTMTAKMKGMGIKQGSCYGPRLSVVAPIENVVTAVPHEEAYYNWKGTPMGEEKEKFEGPYVVQRWGATSTGAPGFDEEIGYGRINFLRTLELARKTGPED